MIRTPAMIKKKNVKIKSVSCSRENFTSRAIDNISSVEHIRKRKKIRATEDFNQLNRTSLAFELKPEITECLLAQNKKTKKTQEYNYLPKVLIDEKENAMSNHQQQQERRKVKNGYGESSSSQSSDDNEDQNYINNHVTNKRQILLDKFCDETKSSSASENAPLSTRKSKRKANFQNHEKTVSNQQNTDEEPMASNIEANVESQKVGRKSVRFLSPKERTEKKRNTFEIENPSTDINLLLSMNESDGTPKQRQGRKCTPFTKKCLDVNGILKKQKLEYSPVSVDDNMEDNTFELKFENSTGSLDDMEDVFEDVHVEDFVIKSEHKKTDNNLVKSNKEHNRNPKEKPQDTLKHRPSGKNVLKSVSTPVKLEKKSMSSTSCTKINYVTAVGTPMRNKTTSKVFHKELLPKSVRSKFDSMTPNKFGTRNKNLRNNLLNRSLLDIKNKSPNKLLELGCPADNLVLPRNISSSKVTSLNKISDSTDKVIEPTTLVLSNDECINITLNASEQCLVGIGLNSTKKNLRRSNSSPNFQDSDDMKSLSPITKSVTPKRKSLSIIDLASSPDDWSCIEIVSPLMQVSIRTKSINNLPSIGTNPILQTPNSTRKRWDKSIGVDVLDSSGNTFRISPRWKSKSNLISDHTGATDGKLLESTKAPMDTLNVVTTNQTENSKLLLKNNDIDSTQKAKASASKPSTRKKMPNFTLIHQMAYDKMESLQEMTERKAKRAVELLSGKKPEEKRKLRSPKCRKPLRYSPKVEKNKKITTVEADARTNVKISKPASKPKVADISKPVLRKPEQSKIKSNVPSALPKKEVKPKPLSKLGFKTGTLPAKSNKEELKAAAGRTSVLKNTVETRRNAVQNIRSNRRFELLMKMRAKK